MKHRLLLLFTFLILVISGFAQSISGTIRDNRKEVVIGATIKVEGTAFGAISDAAGNFIIKNLKPGTYKLRISGIDYATFFKDVSVAGTDVHIEVQLKEDVKQMNEMVVVGYGVQRRRDLTGSVSKIGGKELNDLPVPSFEAAMQGKAAGVQVTVGSGLAGSSSIVRVRGVSSISASGDPLYVIDGIPITQDNFINGNSGGMNNNPLASINPDDIESVEILKDAAANAIYGSRGANGVILITTKRAKQGNAQKWSFSASSSIGTSQPTKVPKMLNSSQWLQLNQEAWENDGHAGRAPLPGGITYDQARNTNTNWVDQTLQTGIKKAFNFSASHAGQKLSTFINFSENHNESYLKGNSLDRTSGRINMDYNATKWLKIGLNTSISRGLNHRVNSAWAGGLGAAMSTALPIYPIYNADGSWFKGGTNPVRDLNNQQWVTEEWRALTGLNIEARPKDYLILKAQTSYDYMNQNNDTWNSPVITGNADKGSARRDMSFIKNFNYYVTASFLPKLNESNHLTVMLGNEYQRANTILRNTYANDVPGLYSSNKDYLLTSPIFTAPGTNWAFLSYFGRANYDYKNKFTAQLVYRMDASSRFGANYRWAQFPSLSAGWILTEEKFLKNNKTISFLKVRAGWGKSGNANIPDNARFGTYSGSANNKPYNITDSTVYPTKLENKNLRWETTNNYDLGIELGLFKDRVTMEFDYYVKKTSDVLMELTIPGSIGFPTYWGNVGSIMNRGVEFSFKTKNIITKNFQWNSSFNVAHNYNEITSIGQYTEDAVSGGTNDTRVVVGHPVGTNYLIRWSRVDPATGRPIYLDANGKETFVYDNNNRKPVGKILPDAIGGFSNDFRYKNWSLSCLFVFSVGSNIYESSQKRQASLITDWNMDARVFDRWRQPGDVTMFPKLTNSYQTYGLPDQWSNTTLWLKDGSYGRIRNLTFSYNIPKTLCNKWKISNARVSLIATNILTITKYTGLDPEIARDAEGSGSGALNAARNMGAQNITYLTPPQEKTYSLQINLQF